MDYTEIHQMYRSVVVAQGIWDYYIDRNETLYYDESGNVKHLVLNGSLLNAEIDTVFILGGVQAETSILDRELKEYFGRSNCAELKASKDLKGNFEEILCKENFAKPLRLLLEKSWHIHFLAVQIFYYGLVDIVDSLDQSYQYAPLYKTYLYHVFRSFPEKTIVLFKEAKYPNIPGNKKEYFLKGIIDLINKYINCFAPQKEAVLLLREARELIERAIHQDSLIFIQDNPEDTHIWVKGFVQFYLSEIYSFPCKRLIFDKENKVEAELNKLSITINNTPIGNYSFVDSTTSPMIQLSDYITSILRKYVIFIDQPWKDLKNKVDAFTIKQMENYRLLNTTLSCSLEFNPLYIRFIASAETVENFFRCLYLYRQIT